MIEDILLKKHMPAGVASKLAGKLGWTTQLLFRRIGRALLTPLYRQSHSRTGNVSDELKLALRWWLEVLKEGICEACSLHIVQIAAFRFANACLAR